jgi:hypothetical protein
VNKNIEDEDCPFKKIYYSPQNKKSITLEVEEETKLLPVIDS